MRLSENMMPVLSADARRVQQEICAELAAWNDQEHATSLERFFTKSNQHLVQRIEHIARTLPPLAMETRAVVCMPTVAFGEQESSMLGRTLLRLDASSVGGPGTEVLVLCNWPKGQRCDSTPEVALKTAQTCKAITVTVVLVELDVHEQNAGYYRALMHGITLWRTLQRHSDIDVIHITMDADTVRIPHGYTEAYLRALDAGTASSAVVGQLDWDNETIPTARIPELLVGNELMRLLPKHGTWRVLSRPELYDAAVVHECVFSRRSFGRGVQANISWKGSAYAHVGGYRPEAHDELDYILRKIFVAGQAKTIAFAWNPVSIYSDSRRALWALKHLGMPPMRQWALPFQADDPIRKSLPDLAEHIDGVSTAALERQINLTLEVFNMPREPLQAAVVGSLSDMGLGYDDYDLHLKPYDPDPALAVAEIRIRDDRALRSRFTA